MKRGEVGPPCPRCGCNDTTVLRAPKADEWFHSGVAKCNCEGCEVEFTIHDDGQAKPETPSRRTRS